MSEHATAVLGRPPGFTVPYETVSVNEVAECLHVRLEIGLPGEAQEGIDSIPALEGMGELATWQALDKLSVDPAVYLARRPALAEHAPLENAARDAFHRFVGRPCVQQALEHSVQSEAGAGSKLTLADSVIEAKQGDKEAEARVDVAIASATAEALFKTKHVTRFCKSLTDAGEVVQHGLTNEQTHLDAIMYRSSRPTPLKRYTLAEVRNGFREQQFARDGTLDDAWMVVASFVPRDMPEEWLDNRGDGFFTSTMTYSLQGTTKGGAELVVESIFDEGTEASEGATYEERQNRRFDLPAYVCQFGSTSTNHHLR